MIELLDKILKAILSGLKRQNYEYKFLVVNGSEPNPQIKVANSIQYEFINSGNSIAIINDTLRIYPQWCGIEPSRVKFDILKNETDVGVYEYRFENINNGFGVYGFVGTAAGLANSLLPYSNVGAVAPFNSLQVIIKQRSAQ